MPDAVRPPSRLTPSIGHARGAASDDRAGSQRGTGTRPPSEVGWKKIIDFTRMTCHKEADRVSRRFTVTAAPYDLVRIRNLLETA